ncbi:lipoxygenase [Xylariaceae sp. FL1019]|nr:lipoxygenase [Xylariaceae sp. FL1019]
MKSFVIAAVLAAAVSALPADTRNDHSKPSYSIPLHDKNPKARASALATKRAGWTYREYPLGGAPLPAGPLANQTLAEQDKTWLPVLAVVQNQTVQDTNKAKKDLDASGPFTSLDDYARLYDNEWQTIIPGELLVPGMKTNYTDDRLFSMARLSANPYRTRRVQHKEKLLFPVDNAASITGLSLEHLRDQGRLFSVDYSDMADLPRSSNYGAICQAFFYICPKTGDFLPLAVNAMYSNSSLIYTPEDSPDDWMLGKLLFNQNDNWYITYAHISFSHSASDFAYLTAIRSLSESHPLMALIERFESTPLNIRPTLYTGIITSGAIDKYYPWTGDGARLYANQVFESGEASNFQSNYIETRLENAGLINSQFGPELKSFPFWEDTSVVVGLMRTFFNEVINSYYTSDLAVRQDKELQGWAQEAQDAGLPDFPKAISSRKQLADMLTHIDYLGTVVHGVISSNGVYGFMASLPFAPTSFYKPLPTAKGATDLIQYMPDIYQAVAQVSTLIAASRAAWINGNQTMTHMWDDEAMLARMNSRTRAANVDFKNAMNDFSDEVRARTFDSEGLNRGMPVIWRPLDPNSAPYWSVV